MTTKEVLEKHGWSCVSHKKRGMFIVAWWRHSKHGLLRQGDAVRVQGDINKAAKEKQTMDHITATSTPSSIGCSILEAPPQCKQCLALYGHRISCPTLAPKPEVPNAQG